nr:uncharacterized protein LOC109159986 [Ipomoea batatas]
MVLHQFVRVRRFPPADGHYGHYNRDKYHVEAEYEDGHVQRNKDKYDGNKEKYQDGYGDYYNRNKDKYYGNRKLYGGLNVEENRQNGYDHHHGNFNKDKYKENKKSYEGFNVKVNPQGRKAFQDFDALSYSSNIHFSDHEQVHSNKGMWSVDASAKYDGSVVVSPNAY